MNPHLHTSSSCCIAVSAFLSMFSPFQFTSCCTIWGPNKCSLISLIWIYLGPNSTTSFTRSVEFQSCFSFVLGPSWSLASSEPSLASLRSRNNFRPLQSPVARCKSIHALPFRLQIVDAILQSQSQCFANLRGFDVNIRAIRAFSFDFCSEHVRT